MKCQRELKSMKMQTNLPGKSESSSPCLALQGLERESEREMRKGEKLGLCN